MNRKRNSIWKAVIAVAVALAFVLPGSTAVANIGTVQSTSIQPDAEQRTLQIEPTSNGDLHDNTAITIGTDEPSNQLEAKETKDDIESDTTVSTDETKQNTIDTVSLERSIIYVDDDNTAGPWDGSWEHPYQYIQDAINNAVNGDTIYVLNGLYTQKLNVNKKVSIIGQSQENTIIDTGTQSGNSIQIIVDYVNMSTFTVKSAYTSTGYGIAVGTSSAKVSNIILQNIVVNKTVGKGYGIYVYYSLGAVDIINCEVFKTQYGIYVMSPANPTRIINCSVHDNTGNGIFFRYYYSEVAPFLIQNVTTYNNVGTGINLDSMNDGDIIGCTSYNNTYSGISLSNSDYVNITNCITYNNNQEGIEVGSGYNHPEHVNITNCTSYNNQIGIYLYAIDCILSANTMYNNAQNFVVEGYVTHYIDPTNTVNGKPIWYLVGMENLTLDESYNIGFLGVILSNNITVINSQPEGVILAETTNSTLYNITVFGGVYSYYLYGGSHITIEDCAALNSAEAGFYIYYTEDVTMQNCTVTNMTGTDGDAFYIRGSPSVYMMNCIAHDIGKNYGFNIYQSPYATIINAQAYNGGPTYATAMALYYSDHSTITNCTVHHFQRGFDLRSSSTYVTLTDCTAYNIQYCGFEVRSSDCTFINCTVYNSEGFYFYNMPRNNLTNVKSYNNKYGFYFYYSTDNILVNCEAYNNTVNGIDIHSSSYANTFTNCKSYNNDDLFDSYGNPVGYGVIIEDNSYGTVFTDCQIYNNNYGVYIKNTPNNVLTNTTINSNNHSFDVTGGAVTDFYQDIDTSNTINGKPIYYLVEIANMTVDETSNAGYLRLVACDNITLENLDMSDLMLIRTANSTVSNITIHDGKHGIHLWESTHNNIIDCSSSIYNNTGHGVYLQDSPENTLTDGVISNNLGHGLYLVNSPNTELTNWTVTGNNYGIYISASPNNILRGNSFLGNTRGFGVDGAAVTDFYQDIDPSNSINGEPIYYIVDDSDKTIDETHSFGYLILVDCDNITLRNLDVQDLLIILTTNSTICNITSHTGKDGIYLWKSSSNEIADCTVFGNTGYGIYLRDSPNNQLTDSVVFSNSNGMYLTNSSGNTIERCTAYSNQNGFYLVSFSNNNYLTDCASHTNSYGIQVSGSTGNTIEYSDFYGNTNDGLYFSSSANTNNIIGCDVYNNNRYGIYLDHTSGMVVENCHIYNNPRGVYGYYLTNSNIKGVDIYGGSYGVYFYLSTSGNTVRDSDIHGNTYGVYFTGSSCQTNTIVNCSVYNNNEGIYSTSYAKTNKMYHNTLAGNNRNAYSSVTTNIWDNGYPSGGNFWSDYTGIDADGDGIGDTPYQVGNVKDNYPLMTPKVAPPPVITNVAASPEIQSTTDPVNITCTVTDYAVQVDTVLLHVDGPEGYSLDTTMTANGSMYWYSQNYTTMGIYHYVIWANNTFGRETTSDTYLFVISDVETPFSAVNPLALWMKTLSFTVTATAYDNTGVENVTLWYRFSSDSTNWTNWTAYSVDEVAPWSWTFTASANGYYQFYSIAIDEYGNIEEAPSIADASTGVDTIKPVTTISHTGPMGGNGWYIGSVSVTLSSVDTFSGVESIWYRIDTGYWTLYTSMFQVTGEGIHTIAYYSFDHAGNREDTKTTSIKIDTKAPTTTHRFDGLMAGGIYIDDVTVTLTATDGSTGYLTLAETALKHLGVLVDTSGVNYTMYKINDGEWTTYTDSFIITEDGNYTVYYYSVDNAGNIETTREATFTLENDLTPPETTHSFTGATGDNNWYVSDVTVTLTATDNAAGVDYTMYKVNAGNWTTYTTPFRVKEDGIHTVQYFSVDKLGNEETPKGPFEVGIDRTKPEINLTVEKTGLAKWLLTATVNDNTSGIAKVEFYLDNQYLGEDTTGPDYTWEVTQKGTAQAIVYDNAGNSAISEEKPVSVSLESQPTPNNQAQSLSTENWTLGSLLQRLFNLR